jgi:hypothetical protein
MLHAYHLKTPKTFTLDHFNAFGSPLYLVIIHPPEKTTGYV